MATLKQEATFIYTPDEERSGNENLDRIFSNIRAVLDGDNCFKITLHMTDTPDIDPIEMADILVNAGELADKIKNNPILNNEFNKIRGK